MLELTIYPVVQQQQQFVRFTILSRTRRSFPISWLTHTRRASLIPGTVETRRPVQGSTRVKHECTVLRQPALKNRTWYLKGKILHGTRYAELSPGTLDCVIYSFILLEVPGTAVGFCTRALYSWGNRQPPTGKRCLRETAWSAVKNSLWLGVLRHSLTRWIVI